MQQLATGKKTTFDLILEVSGWVLLAALWVISILVYLRVPDPAPIHFSFSGVITKYGHKVTLLFFPATATVMATGLSLLSKYSTFFASGANDKQVLYSARLICWLKLCIHIVFLLVLGLIFQSSFGEAVEFKQLVFPTVIAVVGVPVTYYIYRIFSLKKQHENPGPDSDRHRCG
jgi:uncharacterized membrane protein